MTIGASVSSEHHDVVAERPSLLVAMRGIGGGFTIAVDRLSEKSPMPHGLDGEEDAVEQDRDPREQTGLERREAGIGLRLGEIGKDERKHGERGNDHEKGARAFEIVLLLPIAQPPHEQRRADHAVQHDHQGREHGVAGKRRVVLAMQDDRGHERDLDDDHRNGEHERAVRLLEIGGDGIGMAHHAEGAPQHHPEKPNEGQNGERVVVQMREERSLERIRREHRSQVPPGWRL